MALILRAAPEPDIEEIVPPVGAPGIAITIFGEGFGLYDDSSSTPSRVRFRARNSNGVAQNINAIINSWSRDRINVTIPTTVPVSRTGPAPFFDPIADTVEVTSSVFNSPTYYPYLIGEADTITVKEMELTNLSPATVVIKWKTAFSGADSVIMAGAGDTLDVVSTAAGIEKADADGFEIPTFVLKAVPGPALTDVASTVATYVGQSSSTDQVHFVQIEDLNPATDYKFILAMAGSMFYGDSVGNINGPYFPAKIDRSNPASQNVRGFRLRTPPAQTGSGETFIVAGKAFTNTGSATNAVVSVKIVNFENIADTSLAVASEVRSDSTWEVNLGNALTDTLGVSNRVYSHKQGDYLVVTVRANDDVGYLQTVVTRGASTPQIVNLSEVIPSLPYLVRANIGLNLIGLPVDPLNGDIETAEALLNKISGGAGSLTRYISATGTQETIAKSLSGGSGSQFVGSSNFDLELLEGYFLAVDQLRDDLIIEGAVFPDTIPVKTFSNAALYWISRPAQKSSKFYSWSARTMLANIANSTEIFRFNEDKQKYENAYINPDDGKFGGNDFHIDVSEGYILRVTAASQWDPNIPTAAVAEEILAAANAKFDGLESNSAAYTLNTSKASANAGQGAVRSVRLSNVTSSAATVSWVTDINGSAVVRYGKAGESMDKIAAVASNMTANGMRIASLSDLDYGKEYAYEIVANGVTYNNNGQPWTFTAAQIGIGIPYTIFGRILDENNEPLAGTLVYIKSARGEEESNTLVAVTDENGIWDENLANLKNSDGSVYTWSAGDEIKITATYQDAAQEFRTLVSGQSPQNVIKTDGNTEGNASKNEVSQLSLPKAFALGQNFPNPFNPSTTISYDVPDRTESVQVELKVYNIRGQVVKALVNEFKEAGHYKVQWDGLNDRGENVASGVYFYRIKAGDFSATRKMVLLK